MKENHVTIGGLFPVPVLNTKMEREFTDKENDIFANYQNLKLLNNAGNKTSDDKFVLDHPTLKNLKKIITLYLNVYIEKIYNPKEHIEAYVTQSWLNYTKPGQYHHKHNHPNSFLSGCLYIQANSQYDSINFVKSKYETIFLECKSFNLFNSSSWQYPVNKGDIIIFPSSLEHYVETTKSNETRISLAFNSFIKGKMGSKIGASFLEL